MIRKVLEISSDGLFLHKKRGFLSIQKNDTLVGEVPLSDISVLMLTARGVTFTKELLLELNQQGTPVILCGKSFLPESIISPMFGNYEFSGRLKIQLGVSLPLQKQLWKKIVIEKISNQALVLEVTGHTQNADSIKALCNQVSSGDTTNKEAVAAKAYWSFLFGENFFRRIDEDVGVNAYLNYGYAILRSIVARAVSITGLLPSLGIHHSNKQNNYCLVDDLMEPFRPIVDILVYLLNESETLNEIQPYHKSHLAIIAHIDVLIDKGRSPLIKAVEDYVHSVYEVYKNKDLSCLRIPKIIKEEITEQTNPLPF